MIQSFREKLSGIIAIAIIILLAIPLAFIGVDSLFLGANRVSNVASVNGEDISEQDFSRAIAARQNQFAQLMGENYSPDLIDPEELESSAMSGLIDLTLFLSHAQDNSMGVTDSFVGAQIQQMPQFQVGGEFSDPQFRNYLSQMGYTVNTFVEAFGEEIVSQQLVVGLQTSAFATEQVLERNIAISQEKRSYQTLLLPVASVLDDVEVSEQEIAEYYESNSELFMLPERVSLDYVELSAADFSGDVEVTEAEVEERFELMQAALPARREAAHILVEVEEGDAHLATLDEIQQELEAGTEFSQLAEQYSSDIASSGNGGLLGYTDGTSFSEAFEAALAQLEVGEVSGPVLTDAGIHIIQLTNIERSGLELSNESANIENEIRLEKAGDIYRQNLERLLDAAFSTNDLDALIADFADVKTLDVLTTDLFDRQSGTGIAASELVRGAAFGQIVLDDQLNSEVLEITDTKSVVIHLRDRVEPGVAELAEVQEQIESVLTREKGTALLEASAKAIEARLIAGDEAEDIARDEDIEWQVQLDAIRGTGGVEGRTIFSASVAEGLPKVGSEVQLNGDYLIYIIDEVSAGSLEEFSEIQVTQLSSQLSQTLADGEVRAYTQTLRENADIDIKLDIEY